MNGFVEGFYGEQVVGPQTHMRAPEGSGGMRVTLDFVAMEMERQMCAGQQYI